MKHSMESRYEAPRAVLLRMFADRAFHERKLDAMGIARYEVLQFQADDARARVSIARQVPVQLPGIKKSSGSSRVVHTEDWDLQKGTATIVAEPQGMPIEMRCSARIEDDGDDACVVRYDWDIKANVPVVGRKLEKFVASDMETRAEQEADAGRALIDDYR